MLDLLKLLQNSLPPWFQQQHGFLGYAITTVAALARVALAPNVKDHNETMIATAI